MRYQLPPGITAISVCGVEFQGDENGTFWVEPHGRQDLHIALQSPSGGNLQLAAEQTVPASMVDPALSPKIAEEGAEADPEPVQTTAQAADRARAVRRDLLNQLASYGVKPDGRTSAPYLRELLEKARADADAAARSEEAA